MTDGDRWRSPALPSEYYNINQIARSVNAGIATAEDARRGLFLLDKVYELMYQVANP